MQLAAAAPRLEKTAHFTVEVHLLVGKGISEHPEACPKVGIFDQKTAKKLLVVLIFQLEQAERNFSLCYCHAHARSLAFTVTKRYFTCRYQRDRSTGYDL